MCGFISVLGPEGTDVLQDVLAGLLATQHRGQDAAGVVTFRDGFQAKRGKGLVREVFAEKHLARLRGNMAVGHVRYPTVGRGEDTDVQPFWLEYPVGIAMAHNGNVTNFLELKRDYFSQRDVSMATSCDLAAVLYVFADALMARKNGSGIEPDHIREAVTEVFRRVQGAYSVVGIVAGAGMFAFRDPFGIKPGVLGMRETKEGRYWALASESVVLDVAGYETVRNLRPGEAIWIDRDREVHSFQITHEEHRPCIFEYIYFSRPDSFLDEISVYRARLRLGEELATRWRATGLEIDAVIPVPESARTAAQSMAEALDVPYREGFVKNRYVGRSFIMPSDAERRDTVRHKLNPIRMEFEGKRVLIVDDSIVRGTTSRQIVRMAREMGAEKVYLASYSSALKYPCPYGIDMATRREFIARDRTDEEIAAELGCDHLVYQQADAMIEAVRGEHPSGGDVQFCTACFDGRYPTGDVTPETLAAIETERLESASAPA
ncbi:MAG: amidophosphoribosyltransferase [Planctomycetota bacterium]